MLELEDFISESMISIVKGIKKAQADPLVGDHIAPLLQGEKRNDFGNFHLKGDTANQATVLQFEVSVGVTSTDGGGASGKAKAKLIVVEIEAGGEVKSQREHATSHRLKFAVPIRIPTRSGE